MNRRDFLRSGAISLGAATKQMPNLSTGTRSAVGREVYPMMTRWKFSPTQVPAARETAFDDSGFTEVVLPHTNKALPWHSFDDKDYEFVSTYRREFHLPRSANGKRVFVDFDGVMCASTVWCNGTRLGEYRGGYTPFSFELTQFAKPGRNVLTVDVDSTERKDIPPFGFEVDYLTFGGIYRDVSLRVVPEVFLENVHARTIDVLTDHPQVAVDVYFDRAPGARSGKLQVHAQLRDDEETLASTHVSVSLRRTAQVKSQDAGQGAGARAFDPMSDTPAAALLLDKLKGPVTLWDLKTPKLYTLVVQLRDGEEVLDETTRRESQCVA